MTSIGGFALPSVRFALLSFLLLPSITPLFAASSAPEFTLTIAAPLKVTVHQGDGAVHSGKFELRNTGHTALEWNASASQAWLHFEPASGAIAPNADVTVELVADPTGFAPGIYATSAKISASKAELRSFEVIMTEEAAFPGVPIGNAERTFPPDSGMVNVKTQFGAKGDGISDDTEAIQRAVSSTVHHSQGGPRIVYFPEGTYMVSRPIREIDLRQQWSSLLTLQGENRATTVIKLVDNSPLYHDRDSGKAVVKFASQNGTPKGGGNSAFDNNIFDLTIDVGRGNPGAIALDFLGNNYCAVRNVTLQSSDPGRVGAVGISMTRYATGPCLMKNVLVNGFDYGIRTANNEYSITFEDLILLNQKIYGIYNSSNVLSIRHLFSANSVPAIYNENPAGLITLIGGILRGGSGNSSAIQNQGTVYVRDVSSSGYRSVLQGQPGSSIAEYDSGPTFSLFGEKASSLNLPIEETPLFEDSNLSHWKSVTAYGADPSGVNDSSAAVERAIDSGASVVYFPTGVYTVSSTIHIRGKVRILEGFNSSLNPAGEVFARGKSPAPLLRIDAGSADVTLDHFRIGAFYPRPVPGVIFVQQDSARPVVLRDSIIGSYPTTIAYQNTSQGSGTLFVEDVTGTPWQCLFPQKVFARQINPEANSTKIINRGGKMWVVGLKTEGTGTNIETDQGGATEVLGGLLYPVWKVFPETPAFAVKDSQASFIYMVSSYKQAGAGTNLMVQVQETQGGVTKSLPTSSLPARGLGNAVPLYATTTPSQNRQRPAASLPSR